MPPLRVRVLAAGERERSCVLSVTAPPKMLAAELVMVATPELPDATEMGLRKVTTPAPERKVLAEPLVSPSVMTLVSAPNELAKVPVTVPALIVRPDV